MKNLGTILPTAATLAIGDKLHAEQIKHNHAIGKAKLFNYETRFTEGETRYYDGANRYAVISLHGDIKWFAMRQDGYFYAESK